MKEKLITVVVPKSNSHTHIKTIQNTNENEIKKSNENINLGFRVGHEIVIDLE